MDEKKKSALSLIAKIAVVIAILTIVILNYDKLTNIDIKAIVNNASSIYIAIALVIGVFFLKSLLFVIPASLIYLSVGMAFDPIIAIIISFAGIAVEISATYLLGNFLGGDAVNKLLSKSKSGRKLIEKDVSNKFSVLFAMRFSGLPIDFTSLFLGASGCKYPVYALASISGIMPRVIVLILLGDSVYNLIPMSVIVAVIIGALVAAVIAFIIKFIIDKRKNNTTENGEAENV